MSDLPCLEENGAQEAQTLCSCGIAATEGARKGSEGLGSYHTYPASPVFMRFQGRRGHGRGTEERGRADPRPAGRLHNCRLRPSSEKPAAAPRASNRHRRPQAAANGLGCGPAFALSAHGQGGSSLFGRPLARVEGVLARVGEGDDRAIGALKERVDTPPPAGRPVLKWLNQAHLPARMRRQPATVLSAPQKGSADTSPTGD